MADGYPKQYVDGTSLVCKQMSQLAAWSWLDLPDDDDHAEEKKLQKEFSQQILDLGLVTTDERHKAYEQKFRDLLSDSSTDHLTLRQVYKNLTGLDNYALSEDFVNSMGYVTSTDTFFGTYIFDFVHLKFVANLPYPPKPEIPGFDDVLEAWTKNQTDYIPPSPYIPFHGT